MVDLKQKQERINLFMSHSHQNKSLTDVLTKFIETGFLQRYEIFNTSNKPVSGGHKFRDEIKKNLEIADVVLVFLTHNSLNSNWVHFESGAAWLISEIHNSEKYIIPCTYGVEIPHTLQELMGSRLDQEDGCGHLVSSLMEIGGMGSTEEKIKEMGEELFTLLSEVSHQNPVDLHQSPVNQGEDKLVKALSNNYHNHNFFSDKTSFLDFLLSLKIAEALSEDQYNEIVQSLK